MRAVRARRFCIAAPLRFCSAYTNYKPAQADDFSLLAVVKKSVERSFQATRVIFRFSSEP